MFVVYSSYVHLLDVVAYRCGLSFHSCVSEVADDGDVLGGVELEVPIARRPNHSERRFFWGVSSVSFCPCCFYSSHHWPQENFRVPKETTDTKRCTNEHVFTPTGHAQIAENVGHKPGYTLPSLSTPPPVSRTVILSKNIVPLYSKVCKPLFQDGEENGKATDLGANVLENEVDLAETDGKTTS